MDRGAREVQRVLQAPGAPLLLALCAVLCMVLLGAPPASADGTPTPQRPYRIYLPLIIQDHAPAQPVTVVFQQGNNGYTGMDDTYISSYGDPYAPHGFEPILAVRWQRNVNADAEAALLHFDVSSIPAGATVQSATLDFYVTGRSNDGAIKLSSYEILRPWVPAFANWYSATLTSAWASPGCNGVNSDRLALATDTIDVSATGVWKQLAVTSIVQDWVSQPAGNNGLTIKPVGTTASANVRYELAGALHPDPGLRPRLTVRYIVLPTPQPTVTIPAGSPTPTASATPGGPTATATPTVTPAPTWTPTSSWWSTDYSYRRRLTVQAAGETVGAGYSVSLTLSTADLAAAGKLRADLRDWRIVVWNGWTWTEIDRDVVAEGATWFALPAPLVAGSQSDQYFVYYGHAGETGDPLADKSNVYAFYDDFDSYDGSKWPWPMPSGVDMGGGVITVTAYNASGGPADSCPGSYDCMLSRQTFGAGYQVEHRAMHPDYIYGKKHDADQGLSDDGHTNEIKMRSYNVSMFQRVNRSAGVSDVQQCCQVADTAWHTFRITRLPGSILYQVDDSAASASTTHLPALSLPVHIRAYSDEPYEASRNVVDWIKVRAIVANEPVVTWGREETAEFRAPGSSQ